MTLSVDELAGAVVSEASLRLAESKKKIRHCLNQLTDEQVWWRQAESQNSIGNLILHLCGNVRQRIVSEVGGELDTRNRPQEFSERRAIPKDELLRQLDVVVQEASMTLTRTTAADLLKSCRVRGVEVTALRAIFESVSHFVGHTHQLIYITRCLLGDAYWFEWTPSTPEEGARQ